MHALESECNKSARQYIFRWSSSTVSMGILKKTPWFLNLSAHLRIHRLDYIHMNYTSDNDAAAG